MKVFKFICIEYNKIWERCYSHEEKDDYDFLTDCHYYRRQAIKELIGMEQYITSIAVLKRLSHNLFKIGYKYVKPIEMIEHYVMVWDEYLPDFNPNNYPEHELDTLESDLMDRIHKHNKKILNEIIIRKFP